MIYSSQYRFVISIPMKISFINFTLSHTHTHTRYLSLFTIKFQLNNEKWKQFKCKWFTYLPTYRRRRAKHFYFLLLFVDTFVCANLSLWMMPLTASWNHIVRTWKESHNCNKHVDDDDAMRVKVLHLMALLSDDDKSFFFIPFALSCLTEFSLFIDSLIIVGWIVPTTETFQWKIVWQIYSHLLID